MSVGPDKDYESKSGTLQFAAGVAEQTVKVTVYGGTGKENDEEFFLALKTPNFGAMPDGSTAEGRVTPFGRGIVRNDDFPGGYVDAWTGWGLEPNKPNDKDTNYQNGTWLRGWDGNTPTYRTPGGTPWVHSMIGEGPYLKSAPTPNTFRFTVDWRVGDPGQSAQPMRPTGDYVPPFKQEHYGNSGVYIHDRYEVQTISSTVPFTQPVPPAAPSTNTQLTPGWAYGVPEVPGNTAVNNSYPPGQWNRMVIEYTPPVLGANNTVAQPAKLKVYFVTYDLEALTLPGRRSGEVAG